MPKRKDSMEGDEDVGIPLPIQTFLWRQTSPFIRPKLFKLQEATCLEIKEACKSFEKVLVQNIQFGLSPSLTEAISSVSRWRFVQAAFPHLMHCCAALLYSRKDHTHRLGSAETKLLYTMHWVMLDAAEECTDLDTAQHGKPTCPFHYLFSIPAIEVFIYLYAPLCMYFKESDFLSFRLESGLKIWKAMWQFQHPDIPCFTTCVKPKRTVLKGRRPAKTAAKFGDVYVGRNPSCEARGDPTVTFHFDELKYPSKDQQDKEEPDAPPYTPNLSFSKSKEQRTAFTFDFPLDSPRDFKNGKEVPNNGEAMPSSTSSGVSRLPAKLEFMCEICHSAISSIENGCNCTAATSARDSPTSATSSKPASGQKTEEQKTSVRPQQDACMATFLDVAVLRCLFIPQWVEEGVFWALQFLFYRLETIMMTSISESDLRRRSNSLPLPKIEISFTHSSSNKKDDIDSNDASTSFILESPFLAKYQQSSRHARHSSERTHHHKKIKVCDLRAFMDSKLRSKSDKQLENIDVMFAKDETEAQNAAQYGNSALNVKGTDRLPPRPQSALAKLSVDPSSELTEPVTRSKFDTGVSDMIRGKSMPSLRHVGVKCEDDLIRPAKGLSDDSSKNKRSIPNPIITVTEHTPTPSPEHGMRRDSKPRHPEQPRMQSPNVWMVRSQTDSKISYRGEDVQEATGSVDYITKDGRLDYIVILKAVHAVTLKDRACSVRVCESVLNLLGVLIRVAFQSDPEDQCESNNESSSRDESKSRSPTADEELPIHYLFMDCVMRVFTHLGCPHGCGDGHRGPPADLIRTDGYTLFGQLHRINRSQFRKFFREVVVQRSLTVVLDFFHAFVGFCIDPGSNVSPVGVKKAGLKVGDAGKRTGYASNFGATLNNTTAHGVEGLVMTCVFKSLVTRLVNTVKEISNPENIALYCDVRQLMVYAKEAHGSIFGRVALSGLLDSVDHPNRKGRGVTTCMTRVLRPVQVVESDSRDSPHSPFMLSEETTQERPTRKSIFRKKSSNVKKVSSTQSMFEEVDEFCPSPSISTNLRHHALLNARLSISEEDHSPASAAGSPIVQRRKSSRFPFVNWLKSDKGKLDGDSEDDRLDSPGANGNGGVPERPSSQAEQFTRHTKSVTKPSQQGFLYWALKRNKNKHGSFEEPQDCSRRNSAEFEKGHIEPEMIILKEKKIVNTQAIFTGMQRFSFLMETCLPGTVPDPYFLAAALDLQAPIVARAALLLECSHFVHRCNRGQWPVWMKLNLPMFRPSGPLANRGTPSGLRRTHILQRAAGRMFYQWAEALGARLEDILNEENIRIGDVVSAITDDAKKKQLKRDDEEEDFLDEACVNPSGTGCPLALKMVACQLLLEITAFLRETYAHLPKSSRLSHRDRIAWDRLPNPNRRWSMGLGSIPQTSAQSLISMPDFGHVGVPTERKISFVIHEPGETESANSSNTTLTMTTEDVSNLDDKKGRRITQGRAHLLRRGAPSGGIHNTSFKRRSFRLKKVGGKRDKDDDDNVSVSGLVFKRSDSIKSKRKVSAISDRSDTSEHADHDISGEDSPGILSDELPSDSPVDAIESDDNTIVTRMPWMKVIVQLTSSQNFICNHQQCCHPNCYRRQMRACNRLITAVRKVYGEDFQPDFLQQQEDLLRQKLREKEEKREKKMARKVSSQPGLGSPVKRKESFGKNQDKIEKGSDCGMSAARSCPGSMTHLAKDPGELPHLPYKDTVADGNDLAEERKVLPVIVKYFQTQVQNPFHCSFSILIKGGVILAEEIYVDMMPVAWEMLLENDQNITSSAAVFLILSAVKAPEQATELICRELQHEDPSLRINAILRFQAMWRHRYQTWPRMEEGAHQTFKIPPPGIDFTLPSPKIGIESSPVVDPPWMPHYKTKVEEVTINQDQSRSFVTATKTRKKQQMEMVQAALHAEEEKKRLSRENFLLTTIPITMQSAYEPALYHSAEEHDDVDDDQSDQVRPVVHHIQVASSVFPSCLCTAAIPIINLLDDATVSSDGTAVYQVAHRAIWSFLVEDPSLFLRYFLEKLTKERQDEMIQILRRLVRFVWEMPPQAGFALFNYMIGYIMFYVRTPVEGGQEMIGSAMSLLWMLVSSIQGVYLKDLKQILRKEQCDTTVLITANVPMAKKVVVHGQDAAGIPSQFPVHEDTQFSAILQDSIEFFGIEESQKDEWYLLDHKTNQMHNLEAYVRDFYFFKRSQYPQLTLVRMRPEDAYNALQRQAFDLKFNEIGKVLLTLSILRTTHQIAARVFFLHEELQKAPSFPRKALEADLGLYQGVIGNELLGVDTLHKLVWVKLVSRMFEAMAGTFAHSSDIHLFVNVLNGALVLHCEDSSVLRICMATLINAACHFKNIFATNGYCLVMPTILRIYSHHQTNPLLSQTIEFVCKQFYILHRKPFILQLYGSVAPILDFTARGIYGDVNKVEPHCLFKLLLGLEKATHDPLEIMELVDGEKPLKALDFCYQMDLETFTVLDAISLCVTVVAYSPDSARGHQILCILEALLPHYLKYLQTPGTARDTATDSRAELQSIHLVAGCVKALINNSEILAKNYTGPQNTNINLRSSSVRNITKSSYSPAFELDEESHSRLHPDANSKRYQEREGEDSQHMQNIFRKPRDALLNVVAEFMSVCTPRYFELCKKLGQESKPQDLMDTKCHMKLADVAHSLLKMSPYDPITMSCIGLQRYMNGILPNTDWSQESLRPALMLILRRLDKTFNKIFKKSAIRRNTDWNAAANLLKGIYLTLSQHPYIAHIPHLKTLINVCQSIIVGDPNSQVSDSASSMSSTAVLGQTPPHTFCNVVVKLIAMQVMALGDALSIEQICGGSSVFPSPEKTEIILMNFVLPLCLRVGCSRKDFLVIRQSDVTFILNAILNTMNPPTGKGVVMSHTPHKTDARLPSISSERSPGMKIKYSLIQVAFLGLKILIACFENHLLMDWQRIARCIHDLDFRVQVTAAMWNFLDFVVTHRSPLFIVLLPFIHQKLSRNDHNSDHDNHFRDLIKEKLQGFSLPPEQCRANLLVDMSSELKKLQQDLRSKKSGEFDSRKSVAIDSPEETVQGPYPSGSDTALEYHSGISLKVLSPKPTLGMSFSSGSTSPPDEEASMRKWSMPCEVLEMEKAIELPAGVNNRGMQRFLRRTSYHEGEGQSSQELLGSLSPTASSEPRLSRFTRRSTLNIRKRTNRSFGAANAPRGPDGKPTSASARTSPVMESEGAPTAEGHKKHRLQRQMAQSRKAFHFRSIKKAPIEVHMVSPDGLPHTRISEHRLSPSSELSVRKDKENESESFGEIAVQPLTQITVSGGGRLEDGSGTSVDFKPPKRRGAIHLKSRSPSPTPSPSLERLDPQVRAFLSPSASRSDSADSLNASEKSALIREGECRRLHSPSSTFDSKDENTLL